ncbi:MAG: SMP-30/gluconolactonase/LRE family protein, partial [Terriglobales bacterium]
ATLGIISAQGVFTAPSQLPAAANETITATSVADTSKSGSAQLTLSVPAAQFSFTPAQSALSLGKAASGTATFQVASSPGFNTPIQFAVSGLPVNVTASVAPASLTSAGAVTVTLTTASISLAQSAIPVTLTGTSTDGHGNPLVKSATVALTITGWAGHVRTVAGAPGGVGFEDGSGATDELQASALVSDGNQTIYFSDKRGTALRSFGLANQTVTTLLGGPYNFTVAEGDGMAWDPSSNTVYIADALRNRVVAYTLGSGDIRVVAGGDIPGHSDGVGAAATFDFPHGLAISPDHTTLYVADTNNELIRKIDLGSQTVTTIAGQFHVFRSADGAGTAATFCQPTGLAMDPAGTNLFVTDQCGYDVRDLSLPAVQVTTVAGSGQI